MKLTIIIVSYNVRYYLQQCLDSIEKAVQYIDAEVCVIDNHSKDDTVAYIRQHYPYVKVIASMHNNGFAKANNIAIRQTDSEYVLLLNPDTVVGENALKECVDFMDSHTDAGGVGVKMLRIDGSSALESRRGLPTPMTSFYKMSGLCEKFPNSHRFGKYYMGYLPWNKVGQIEVISGAFMMLRRTALNKSGLLDEGFFMYGEDIDLSYRLLKNGYTNWYVPAKILHYKGESTQKSSFKYVHVFYEAMLIFFKKHYGHLSVWLNLPIKTAIYVKASIALVGMMSANVKKAMGLSSFKKQTTPDYLFIGRPEMISYCRQLAAKNGLAARYVVGDSVSLPGGHLHLKNEINATKQTYIVYHVGSYSYEQLLDIFDRQPQANILMGFYHDKENIIITDREIIG